MRYFVALVVILLFVVRAEAEPRPEFTPEQTAVLVSAVESVCPLLVDEAQLVASIKEEKVNPTGVVNLRTLHMLGQALQSTRVQLRLARKVTAPGLAIFRRWARKPLDLGFCVVHEQQREEAEAERDAEAAEAARYRN